jgi:AbrB family looped-hinge helix DNA binding protein
MARTRVSSKYQVVIPKDVREESGLRKGQTFQVISKRGVITLVPEQPLSELKGFAKRVRATGLREKKDRF